MTCVKLNELVKRGKIQKNRSFYKFMNDVVQIMYDSFHPFDREVIEFFDTITYFGGKATACFIRGPMNLGDGKDSHRTKEKKMNLGGPSESVCRKFQASAGYNNNNNNNLLIGCSITRVVYIEVHIHYTTFRCKKSIVPCFYRPFQRRGERRRKLKKFDVKRGKTKGACRS